MDFDQFYDRLPIVALAEVARNIRNEQVVSLALCSDRWREAIERGGIRYNCKMEVDIHNDSVKFSFFTLSPSPALYQCRRMLPPYRPYLYPVPRKCITFRTSSQEDDEMKCISDEPTNRWIECTARNFSTLESTCLEWFQTMGRIFTGKYTRIEMNTTGAFSDFGTRLLSLLPRGTVDTIILESDRVVSSRDILTFRERVRFLPRGYAFFMKFQMDDSAGGRMLDDVECKELNIADAHLLPGAAFRALKCGKTKLGNIQLSSRDLNEFFRMWKENGESKVKRVQLTFSRNNRIHMRTVLRGLDAQRRDQQTRNRFICIDANSEDGWNVTNVNGDVATILYHKKVLYFVVLNGGDDCCALCSRESDDDDEEDEEDEDVSD